MKTYIIITTFLLGLLIGGIAVYQYDTIHFHMIEKDADVAIIPANASDEKIDTELNKLVPPVPSPAKIQELLVFNGADIMIDGVIGDKTIQAWYDYMEKDGEQ